MRKYFYALMAIALLTSTWLCACSSSGEEAPIEEEEEEVVEKTYY